MISDFEARVAVVLGGLLPEPFRGRVEVAPGSLVTPGPRVLVDVRAARPYDRGLGDRKRETTQGQTDPRRIQRASCTLRVTCEPALSDDRQQERAGLEAVSYALDAPELRDGSALQTDGDPGFAIDALQVVEVLAARDAAPDARLCVIAEAAGVFWPRNLPGSSGPRIPPGGIHIRGAVLPLSLRPAAPALVAGGPPIALQVVIGLPSGSTLPFGRTAMFLERDGGRAGLGTLSGGDPSGDVLLVAVSGGRASVTYAPPAEPVVEYLVVTLDHGDGSAGIELGRFAITVRAT